MTSGYKITYFPSEALCEPIRWLFAYAGIEYEDFRFERENWLKIKPSKYSLVCSNKKAFGNI